MSDEKTSSYANFSKPDNTVRPSATANSTRTNVASNNTKPKGTPVARPATAPSPANPSRPVNTPSHNASPARPTATPTQSNAAPARPATAPRPSSNPAKPTAAPTQSIAPSISQSTKNEEKKKYTGAIIAGGICLFLALTATGLWYADKNGILPNGNAVSKVRGFFSEKNGSKSDRDEKATIRANTFKLVKMYFDKKEYDRALDKLEVLLIDDPNDKDAISWMDKIIVEKNKEIAIEKEKADKVAQESSKAMADLLEEQKKQKEQAELEKKRIEEEQKKQQKIAEENSKAMAKLLEEQKKQTELEKKRVEEEKKKQAELEKKQQEEEKKRKIEEEKRKAEDEKQRRITEENNKKMAKLLEEQKKQAEQEKKRLEEQQKQQKLLEEKKKQEEVAKKAAEEKKKQEEEAAKKKKEILEKEMTVVNDEIKKGKTALRSGSIDLALNHFKMASQNLPVSEGEPAFSAGKYSDISETLFVAAQDADSDTNKKRLEKEANEYAKKAVELDSKSAQANYVLGMEAMDKKDYNKALELFTNAVNSDGKNASYYCDLGRAQYMLKKYKEAKFSFSTSCQLNPSFAPARYNLGLTNLRLNDQKAALSDFRKVHDIDSHHEKSYLEEGRILFAMKDWNGAISAYNKAVGINSTNRAALQELGSAYSQVGKYSDAESAFRKSLALLPSGTDDPLTYYNLSTVLFEQGKSDEALNYAKRAYDTQKSLKDNNSKVNVIYNYALFCDRNGKVDTAIEKYSEVLKLSPNHVKSLLNLGVMYMKMNPPDSQNALALFKKVYDADKNSFEANNNLGSAYLAQKDYKNAILYFQNALKLDPKNNDVRSNLAQTFASDTQYDNAKTTYMELLRQNAENWDGYIELAKVCIALNDRESAEKYLMFVQIKKPDHRKQEVDNLLGSLK